MINVKWISSKINLESFCLDGDPYINPTNIAKMKIFSTLPLYVTDGGSLIILTLDFNSMIQLVNRVTLCLVSRQIYDFMTNFHRFCPANDTKKQGENGKIQASAMEM